MEQMEDFSYMKYHRYLWWRHQMGTFSALLVLCEGNPPITGGFPSQRPVARSFDIFFDLRLNKRLSKQSRHRCFETPSPSSWRHCNAKGHQKTHSPSLKYKHCSLTSSFWSQSQGKFICVGGSGRFEGWFECRIFCWFRKGKSDKNLMVRFLTNWSWSKEGWPKKLLWILNTYIYIYHTLTLQGIMSTPQCIFINSSQHKV